MKILGISNPKPIKYYEKKGSAQCKVQWFLLDLEQMAQQLLKQKNQEIILSFCKYLKLPISVKIKKNFDEIKIKKIKKITKINYNVPSDISSVLFLLYLLH